MSRSLSRRQFLIAGTGAGALAAFGGAGIAGALPGISSGRGRTPAGLVTPSAPDGVTRLALAATDGWAGMPQGSPAVGPWYPDKLAPANLDTYIFGFRDVTGLDRAVVQAQRGKTQISAPLLGIEAEKELWITLSNLGLAVRPDLTDSHTIHWHGFRNAIPLYDGVPESSISVPIGRDFTYVFRPDGDSAGTYMYHCHFEDVEHVTMGMTGIVFVRPPQSATGGARWAYAASDTAYTREYAIILTEMDSRAHFNDAHIQATDWTDFKPNFWLLNGRAYPDTLRQNGSRGADGDLVAPPGYDHLQYQPNSSLIVCEPGDKVLVRLASLGFQEHSMQMPHIGMEIVGSDARYVPPARRVTTDVIDIGPGESRDVLFTAPTRVGIYPFYNRDMAKYPGSGAERWSGGQRTHVVVVPPGTLGAQTAANTWSLPTNYPVGA